MVRGNSACQKPSQPHGWISLIYLWKCGLWKFNTGSKQRTLFFAGRGVKFSRFQMPTLISWRLSRFYSAHPISKSYSSVLFCCKLLCHPPPPHIVQPVCAIFDLNHVGCLLCSVGNPCLPAVLTFLSLHLCTFVCFPEPWLHNCYHWFPGLCTCPIHHGASSSAYTLQIVYNIIQTL